jgi:hypothetical protein
LGALGHGLDALVRRVELNILGQLVPVEQVGPQQINIPVRMEWILADQFGEADIAAQAVPVTFMDRSQPPRRLGCAGFADACGNPIEQMRVAVGRVAHDDVRRTP